MSLRTRIAALVGCTVLIASLIGGIGTAVSSRNVGRDRVDQALVGDTETFRVDGPRLRNQLQFAFEARSAACDQESATELDDEDAAGNNGRRGGGARLRLLPEFASNMQLLRPDQTVFSACQPLPVEEADWDIVANGEGSRFRTETIDGERFRIVTMGYGDVGAAQFARSLEITEDTLRGLLVRSVAFGLIGAALAAMFGWWFAKRATDPVKALSHTAERVARTQDLGERISVDGDDEIAALATSFNTMLSSLDTSREQQQRLVQDASHELRTPLTSMRTNVELLQRHQEMDREIRNQVLGDIGAELNELTELTTELVDSATEVPTSLQHSAEVDLVDIVSVCVNRATRRHRRQISITIADEHPTTVDGDVGLLSRAVTNLLNNAVKFTDGESPIDVSLAGTSVVVRDRGPGVPEADLDNIFDRFYRATEARSAPGSGLGLSIVKQIVEGHGGQVQARNRTDGGAAIGFSLPAINATDND